MEIEIKHIKQTVLVLCKTRSSADAEGPSGGLTGK